MTPGGASSNHRRGAAAGLAAAAASLVVRASTVAADAPAGQEILIESFASPTHAWTTMSDPVMGGQSSSTFAIEGGVGVFAGEVAIVPFLHAPGFIQMMTSRGEAGAYPDVSSCTALQMNLMATEPYKGYRVSFGTVHLPEGHHAYGYKADFEAPDGQYDDVVIPFTAFSAKWNEATGDQDVSCEEDEQYCPDEATLRNMETLAIWGEGVEGSVRLNVKSISAVGCSAEATPSANEGGGIEETSASADETAPAASEGIELEEMSASAPVDSGKGSYVSIEDFATPSLAWTSQNDPVMGGQSTGTVEVKDGAGRFDGEVKEVSFLHAPGFIKMVGSGAFPDVSMCKALALEVMAEEEYAGNRISFGNVHLPEMRYSRGYHADFAAPVGEYGTVVVPFDGFSAKWDPGTGDQLVTCAEDSQYCPDMATLRNMEVLSLWGEGVAGRVRLRVKSIGAVDCSPETAPSTAAHAGAEAAAHPSTEQAAHASTGAAQATLGAVHHGTEEASAVEALSDNGISQTEDQAAAESNIGSLLMLGVVVGCAAFIGTVVRNLARTKRDSYSEVQAPATETEIV